MSHHPDTSPCVGVSPNPPKLPRHLSEALQDGENPSFGVYDQILHTHLGLARPARSLTRRDGSDAPYGAERGLIVGYGG
jgi:hypothetical protein